jgi:hypothetical protein
MHRTIPLSSIHILGTTTYAYELNLPIISHLTLTKSTQRPIHHVSIRLPIDISIKTRIINSTTN